MKKLIVNKELLNDYTTLSIVFENVDAYSIPVKDILDLYCEAELTNKKDNTYTTSDGFIKISARASQTIEESVLRDNSVGTERDTRLKERNTGKTIVKIDEKPPMVQNSIANIDIRTKTSFLSSVSSTFLCLNK